MMVRAAILAAALAGAAGFSQLPEFSQQYVQRLGGAVDALGEVTRAFDASAAAEGLSRDAALAQMTGSAFVERRRTDMLAAFARHERLNADLAAFETAGPLMRVYHLRRFDTEIMRATWRAYTPALPLTLTGAISAGIGLLGGLLAMRLVLSLAALRRRVASG